MNRIFERALLACVPAIMLGCSTSQPPVAPEPAPLAMPLHQEPFVAKACQLGTSCLAMDPRPFEPCLVAANKKCVDKATEPLLVIEPQGEQRAPEPLQIRSE
jgi:hypothetical protein